MPGIQYFGFAVALDGTNDANVPLPFVMRSLSIVPLSTTVTVQYKPSDRGDFLSLQSGMTVTLEPPTERIAPTRLTLRAASAVAVNVIVGVDA